MARLRHRLYMTSHLNLAAASKDPRTFSGDHAFSMPEIETRNPATRSGSAVTDREKRDAQRAQLRPLVNRRPELYDDDEYSSSEYEKMMELYNGTLASIDEGEIVKSKVLEIRDNMVVLDIGFKSEGSVPLEEFKDHPDLKPGDEVEVLLEHLEDQEGSVVLSKKKADFMRVWEKICVAYENNTAGAGTLVTQSKGAAGDEPMRREALVPSAPN